MKMMHYARQSAPLIVPNVLTHIPFMNPFFQTVNGTGKFVDYASVDFFRSNANLSQNQSTLSA